MLRAEDPGVHQKEAWLVAEGLATLPISSRSTHFLITTRTSTLSYFGPFPAYASWVAWKGVRRCVDIHGAGWMGGLGGGSRTAAIDSKVLAESINRLSKAGRLSMQQAADGKQLKFVRQDEGHNAAKAKMETCAESFTSPLHLPSPRTDARARVRTPVRIDSAASFAEFTGLGELAWACGRAGRYEERLIYQQIEDAKNRGIWIKNLREQTGLEQLVRSRCELISHRLPAEYPREHWLRRCSITARVHSSPVSPRKCRAEQVIKRLLRKMETKKLIKKVPSVTAPKKPMYMLFDAVPDVSLTGGAWYTGSEFDREFIEQLSAYGVCSRFANSFSCLKTIRCIRRVT